MDIRSPIPPMTSSTTATRATGSHPSARGRLRRGRMPSNFVSLLALSAMFIVIWAGTGAGYFWPIWPILGISIGHFKGVCRRSPPPIASGPQDVVGRHNPSSTEGTFESPHPPST